MSKPAGISFIVRCRNEEDNIERCITSLALLEVPHEIVVILHQCTDGSSEIVDQLKQEGGYPIRLFTYPSDVSRAGYETLITPAYSSHSIMAYSNMCFSRAEYNHTMKWDADFTASHSLIRELNDLPLSDAPVVYNIAAVLGANGPHNREPYLTNCLKAFGKHVFWEVPQYRSAPQYKDLDGEIWTLDNTVLKDYWRFTPWFMQTDTYDSTLRQQFERANRILGTEPIGMARASQPECEDIYLRAIALEHELNLEGIHLYD
jgi:hypothetical protein